MESDPGRASNIAAYWLGRCQVTPFSTHTHTPRHSGLNVSIGKLLSLEVYPLGQGWMRDAQKLAGWYPAFPQHYPARLWTHEVTYSRTAAAALRLRRPGAPSPSPAALLPPRPICACAAPRACFYKSPVRARNFNLLPGAAGSSDPPRRSVLR